MTKQISSMKYIVGQTYSVALKTILLPDAKLTARFALGNNFLSVKADIERQGQLVPCFAQLLSEDQLAAHPGKQFLLVEGAGGRYKIAELLNRELLIQVVEPRTEVGILEMAIASNGPRSIMSAMDISVAATRLEAMGVSEAAACQRLSWVAGKGKALGRQRYWQYKRLQGLPVEIQHRVHLGSAEGGIQLNAALHLTNSKRTPDQYKAIVDAADARRKREAAEEFDKNKAYIERETDAVLKASMGEDLGERPAYVPRKRVKSETETLTTSDITDAEKELLGVDNPKGADPNPPPAPGTPLTHLEMAADLDRVKDMGGLLVEVGECIEAWMTRKISSQDFCDQLKALVENGRGEAKVVRRQVREKAGQAKPLVIAK